jgi:hypothetical protein
MAETHSEGVEYHVTAGVHRLMEQPGWRFLYEGRLSAALRDVWENIRRGDAECLVQGVLCDGRKILAGCAAADPPLLFASLLEEMDGLPGMPPDWREQLGTGLRCPEFWQHEE